MMFSFTRRQKIFLGILCLLLLCLVFAPQFAFAEIVDGMLRIVSALVGAVVKGLEWLLGLFQFLFLWIIEFTILDFAKNWQDGGFLSDFRVVWQVLRDFVNLIIVVFFVVTAVMTVFGENRFGFHRKGLLYLILAAVFVNFSAFFTLLFIDLSHILFMLFFNALDASSWGSFSPFSGYSVVLGDVGTGMFNLIVGIIAGVVNWFIILGILYFCIILIERYIIAMFLVLLSPLAALGFFTSIAGGNPLAKKFSGIWEQWWERLGYVFTMPVVLILGFTLLLVLFQGALGQTVDPDNFVKLIGVGNEEGRGILLQLIMASIVLIIGIFKVGEIAKKANIHPALAGKFKFGEVMNKIAKTAPLGIARSVLNPAGRGIGNYKQKMYNKRDQWRREGSRLANIPGIGKPLDVQGKVRRTQQRAQAVTKGVGAVLEGKSGREVAWRSAEVAEDKRIMDIVHNGNQKQKRELLGQALDKKSKVTLTEQQTALLAQNEDLHPLLSQLSQGVSQSTFKRISDDAKRRAEGASVGVVSVNGEKISIDEAKKTYSDEYQARQQAFNTASADFDAADESHNILKEQRDAAQVEFNEAMANNPEYNKTLDVWKKELERAKSSGNKRAVLQVQDRIKRFKSSTPEGLVLRDMDIKLRKTNKKKKDAFTTKEAAAGDFRVEKSGRKQYIKKLEDRHTEERRRAAQIFSNLAASAAAGVAVGGDAAKLFDPEELADAQANRESLAVDTQEAFNTMDDGYAKSSGVAEEMLTAEEAEIAKKNEEESTLLVEKKGQFYKEQAQNADPTVLTASMKTLQDEIDALEKADADRQKRSLAIDKQKKHIKAIRKSFNEQDISDARKLEILGESVNSAASFMKDGTQYLTDQLQVVTDKIGAFEKNAAASGLDLNSSDEYKDMQEEQTKIAERLSDISTIGTNVTSVADSLDEQEAILNSPAYQQALDREKYLEMFSIKSLMNDLQSAMDEREKVVKQKWRDKQTDKKKKPPQSIHKKDSEWESLEREKKNLERIQKEGGASAERQQEVIKAAKQATQRSQRKN